MTLTLQCPAVDDELLLLLCGGTAVGQEPPAPEDQSTAQPQSPLAADLMDQGPADNAAQQDRDQKGSIWNMAKYTHIPVLYQLSIKLDSKNLQRWLNPSSVWPA